MAKGSIHIDFSQVDDSQNFSLVPLGQYPILMHVEAYQTDEQKNFKLDADNEKVFWTTQNGDPKWNLRLEILEGPHKGVELLDNLNFSVGGLKRVKVLYVRGGFGESTDEVDLVPDDFDSTFWLANVEKHEVVLQNGKIREAKRAFTSNGCLCDICKTYNGQHVYVNAKVGFAGFEPMLAAQAAKYAQPAASAGAASGALCGLCAKGDHSTSAKKNVGRCDGEGCTCQNADHPPF
jgi:hypothetical protein